MPLLALGVFHCGAQNFDAIGGTADINWPPAPIASEANDLSGPEGARNAAAHRAPDLILATHRGARNRMPRRHR